MNFKNILNEIAHADPEVFEKTNQRRDVLKDMGRKVALTALPFAIGSMLNEAYGKTTDVIIDTLNYALSLEHLEADFYKKAVADAAGLFPTPAALAAFTVIKDHEMAHVSFFTQRISNAGGTPDTAAVYDFTLGGTLPTFTDYDTLLAVAQVLEDTIVRAYKSIAGTFIKNDLLTTVLNIHSVKARHASHIRQMRRARGANVKPWITMSQSGVPYKAFTQSYMGEENTQQGNPAVSIINIGGKPISANVASEAFDEPLTKEEVLAIVGNFTV